MQMIVIRIINTKYQTQNGHLLADGKFSPGKGSKSRLNVFVNAPKKVV